MDTVIADMSLLSLMDKPPSNRLKNNNNGPYLIEYGIELESLDPGNDREDNL